MPRRDVGILPGRLGVCTGLGFSRGRRIAAWFVLTAALALAAPSLAAASDTTINFDSYPSGTVVSNQYASEGITFDRGPSGPAGYMPTILSDPAAAHSPPNILVIEAGGFCGGGEVRANGLSAQFAAPRNHVHLYVGDATSAAAEQVTLTGYDIGGNAIPGASDTVTTPGDERVDTPMSITDPNDGIAFFLVHAPGNPFCLAVDDVGFDALTGPPAPDFGLSAPSTSDPVVAGQSTTATLVLHRTSTSTGPISLAVSGLPAGVSARLSPNPTTGGDGSHIALTLTAAASAPPAQNVPVTVTGTPSATAGSQPRSVTIQVSVTGNFDLRAQGIDVTQGIQSVVGGMLVPSGISGGNYVGADLAAGKKTIVRFYADAHGAPQGVPGVGAVLHGFRNGVELPDSPLYPDYGPATLPDTGEGDPAPVLVPELESDNNAFTFTLPADWTSGTLQLVADVLPPTPGFTPPQYIECKSAFCQANNSFTLNNVTFNNMNTFALTTIALAVNGTNPVPADQVFTYAKAVTPLSDQDFIVEPYQATLDATSALKSGGRSLVLALVALWDFQNGFPGNGAIGVIPTGTTGVTAGRDSEVDYTPNSTTGDDRPLTSVSHELFHQFGLPHASNECGGGQDGDSDDGGQTGEVWYPVLPSDTDSTPQDGVGQLDGIGLDTTSEPYKLLADGLNGITQYHDFMSYCRPPGGAIGFGDAGNWVSPRNWEAVFNHFKAGGGGARDPSAARSAGGPLGWVATLNPSRLRVVGFVTPRGTQITSVGPQAGPATASSAAAASRSSFTLTARNASGATVASAPMSLTPGHIDHVGPLDEITATVPAAGVDSIDIADNGTIVASRKRPAHAPRVRILAPVGGARVGGGATILVRWRTTNPEHLSLTASIDYSHDGGRSWRTIFIGGDRGRARLPSFYFIASHRARVRVRINDGFNETAAISATFTALGAPPQATILSPAPDSLIAGDARLELTGEAFDQQLRRLSGKRLAWYDGPLRLGNGLTLTAPPLPPGTNRIRLVARDATGRTGSATLVIRVTPAPLPFLHLTIPQRLSRRAQSLTIIAAAAVPATLTMGRFTFDLGRTPSRLHLRIRPGRGPLLLELKVTVNGAVTPFAAEVRRGMQQ